MGNKQSIFKNEELENYQKVTYLTRNEILICYEKFARLTGQTGKEITDESRQATLSGKQFMESADIKGNPFRDRLFKVFSTNDEMTFDDYLNMMSVFSDNAPVAVKCRYAFEIYKFDENDLKERLTPYDIYALVVRLIGSENKNEIKKDDMKLLVEKIFEEADIDKNGELTLDEFEHVVHKSSEFPMNFCIRI